MISAICSSLDQVIAYRILPRGRKTCQPESSGQWKIFAEKKTKRGMETVNVKTEILSASAKDAEGGVEIALHLPCGNRRNLSPLLVQKTFAPNEEIFYTATRLRFCDKTGADF